MVVLSNSFIRINGSILSSLRYTQYISEFERHLIHIYKEHKTYRLDPKIGLWSVFDDMSPFDFTTRDEHEVRNFVVGCWLELGCWCWC